MEKCDIFLECQGYNIFEDTRIMKHDKYNLYSEAIARTQAIMDEHELQKNVQMYSTYSKRVDRIVNDNEDYVDLEQMMEQSEKRVT